MWHGIQFRWTGPATNQVNSSPGQNTVSPGHEPDVRRCSSGLDLQQIFVSTVHLDLSLMWGVILSMVGQSLYIIKQPFAVSELPFRIQRCFLIDDHPTRCQHSYSPVED